MTNRLDSLKTKFKEVYGHEAEVVVNSPGRAEIIGNHTDYNLGYALGCAINQSTLGLFKKRSDNKIIIQSTSPDFSGVVEFDLDKIKQDKDQNWGNYVRAVAFELLAAGQPIIGAEILVDTNFPTSGGLSSSAAFELCLAYGLMALIGRQTHSEDMAWLCKRAENSDFVQSPCGFLDQGVIAFAKTGKMVLLDFQEPIKVKLVRADLTACKTSLVVTVDKTVKRVLGESGYPARRKTCEQAAKLLGLNSLRELSVEEFEVRREKLEKADPIMRQRVEHIVYENKRVLRTVKALDTDDMDTFGQMLSESGNSALDLYALDENTPELRWLMKSAQKLTGVYGARNMGGGFSAVILALVQDKLLPRFQKDLSSRYQQKFPGQLEFIKFTAADGVTVL